MSTGTKSKKKSDVSVTIQEWINRFNKAKGWQNLEVPAPEILTRAGDDDKFLRSPKEMWRQRQESLSSPEDRKEADETVKQATLELEKLEKHLEKTTDESLRKKIEEEIERRTEGLNELLADIKMYDKLGKRIEELKRVEKNLPKEVEGIHQEIDGLRKQVGESKFDVNSIGDKRLDEFRKLHDNISGRVENARQEVMTVDVETDSGTVKQHYAIINSNEYRILFGMLEAGILSLQLGAVDAAFNWVNEAAEKLVEYRNARTGAETINKGESFGPQIDEQLRTAQRMIDSLRQVGRTKAAESRQTAVDELRDKLRNPKKVTDDKFDPLQSATMLAVGTTKDMSLSHEITTLAIAAQRDANTMRTNGYEDACLEIEKVLKEFEAGTDMTAALKAMQLIREEAAKKLADSKLVDQQKLGVSLEQRQKTLKGLEDRFDKFFKHDGDGNVKTQKDGKTGLKKSVKKNSDLPRETIEELELKFKAAQQLLASESIDALMLAESQLQALEKYLSNIEKFPDLYATFKEMLAKQEQRIKGIADSKLGRYEMSKRADLQFALDKIRKDYMTKPQREVLDKINDLEQKITDFKKTVGELRGKKHMLEKKHEERTKDLANIADQLKKTYKNSKPKFDGYHGEVEGELATITSKLQFRTKESLEEAEDLLNDLKIKLDKVADTLKKIGSGDKEIKPDDYLLTSSFVNDAKAGQKKYDENVAQKDNFESEAKKLEKTLGKLKDAVKHVKGDPSNHDALKSEFDTLTDETKSEKSYIDGLKKLEALTKRAERQLAEAKNAGEIVDAELGAAAKMVVEKVKAFSVKIAEFYDKVVYPERITTVTKDDKTVDVDYLANGTIEPERIKAFFKSIVDAIPQTALDQLAGAAEKVADTALDREERLLARNTALASVRALSSVLDGYKPVQHFRLNPFDDRDAGPALSAARQSLPRLELKLLTAIKEKEKEKGKKKN